MRGALARARWSCLITERSTQWPKGSWEQCGPSAGAWSAASGALVGAILGLTSHLRHRAIAAFMSLGAGVLLSAASFKVASEALMLAGAASHDRRNHRRCRYVQHRERSSRDRQGPQALRGMQAAALGSRAPGSGTSIALGTALDAVPEALVLGVTLRAGGPDLALVVALALANVPEALSGTAGMRLASRSSDLCAEPMGRYRRSVLRRRRLLPSTSLSDLGPQATAILKAYGAGALIAMTAETMIPEAFHNGPRYSGVLAAAGFAALILLGELAR